MIPAILSTLEMISRSPASTSLESGLPAPSECDRLKLLRVTADPLQRLIELVRDPGGEFAERRHLTGLHKRLLHGLQFGVLSLELKVSVSELRVLGDQLAFHALFLGHVAKKRQREWQRVARAHEAHTRVDETGVASPCGDRDVLVRPASLRELGSKAGARLEFIFSGFGVRRNNRYAGVPSSLFASNPVISSTA